MWFVACHGGGHSAHAHQFGHSRDEVAEKWNTRPVMPTNPQAREIAEKLMEVSYSPCQSWATCREKFERIIAESLAEITAERDAYKWMLIKPDSVLTLRSSRDGFTMKGVVQSIQPDYVVMWGDDGNWHTFYRDSVQIELPLPPAAKAEVAS